MLRCEFQAFCTSERICLADCFVLVPGWDRFPQKRIKRPWFCTDCRAESHACTSSATIFSPVVQSQRSLCILTRYTVLDKH